MMDNKDYVQMASDGIYTHYTAAYKARQMPAKFYKIHKICTTIWQYAATTKNARKINHKAKRILKLILAKTHCAVGTRFPISRSWHILT